MALKGIIEDVLIKFDKFLIPINFNVLEYEAVDEVKIILIYPFLATRGTLIDVWKENVIRQVNDEEVTFKVYKALSTPSHYHDLCMITIMQENKFRSRGGELKNIQLIILIIEWPELL